MDYLEAPLAHSHHPESVAHLQQQLDRYPVGAPGGELIFDILRTLFTPEEAELAARLPLGFSTLEKLSRRLGMPQNQLRTKLSSLADKGLIVDFFLGGETKYALPPTVVGLFEFSMMRVRGDIDQRHLAQLFHRYLVEEPAFWLCMRDNQTTPFRTLIHEEALPPEYTEVLDYERAERLIEQETQVAVGLCHCRHVAQHRGEECRVFPLESCLSFGASADYLVRHRLARTIDTKTALKLVRESHEQGMVHLCDNVRSQPSFLCNCCSCCCEVLAGYRNMDFIGNVFCSNFEASVKEPLCLGCQDCVAACPVGAIKATGANSSGVEVDRSICLGCGVCVSACGADAMVMVPRAQKRLVPENSIKRTLMMALENGTLQNLLSDPHANLPSLALNRLLGAILRLPPARRLLAREAIGSRFVDFLAARAGG
jgi:Pyruvate/2-oxoacid:ferredoxin oxidoreductase delta subunit